MERLKIVGILGTNGGISLSHNGLHKSFELVGMNTGNLMFQYSIYNNIVNPKIIIPMNDMHNVEFYKENIDVLVIPAANQINPAWDLEYWVSFIEKLNKPFVVVGLGAQAINYDNYDLPLKKGTERFLDLLRERSLYIGVRGEFTQKVLEIKNVSNTLITGCPSNFVNVEMNGAQLQNRIKLLLHKDHIKVNFLAGTLEEFSRKYEQHLYNLCLPHLNKIIYQTNPKLLNYVYYGNEYEDVKQYLEWESKIVAPNMAVSDYKWKIRHKGKYYFNALGWMDEVGMDNISLGMRIHGSIAANQSNSVGVCVAFDSRTKELVETMGYPYINAEEVFDYKTLKELIQNIHFDANGFDEKRIKLKKAMKKVLEVHGIQTKL